MSQPDRDLLVRGIAAAKAKEKKEARFFLEWFLRTSNDRYQRARAWLWLSEVSDDPEEKRNCLEEVLAHDPSNMVARRGLAILDGRLNPNDIIDPNRPPEPSPQERSHAVSTQRFVCQMCGGKMAFDSGGKMLQCHYCGHEQSILDAINAGAMVQEHDFAAIMATVKAHASPVGTQTSTCKGCGVDFVLAPDVLSVNCSYCGSSHVVELSESRRLIPPEGLIPFAVSHQEAQAAFHTWLKRKNLRKVQASPVRGLYVPAWTFDMTGEIRWQGYTYEGNEGYSLGGFTLTLRRSRRRRSSYGQGRRKVKKQGSYPLYEDDVLVPGSHTLPADLIIKEMDRFVLGDVVPYDQAYLADWPAQVYQIAVSDASLVARRKVLEKMRRFVKTRVRASLGSVQDLHLNTNAVVVESFKLVLLPVWISRYRHQQTTYQVLINGQMGKVRAQTPQNWLQKFLGSIVD